MHGPWVLGQPKAIHYGVSFERFWEGMQLGLCSNRLCMINARARSKELNSSKCSLKTKTVSCEGGSVWTAW